VTLVEKNLPMVSHVVGQTVSVDTGIDARPATPPPVRYDAWTETVQR